ncbi:unnamed protein product [Discula destructiva]
MCDLSHSRSSDQLNTLLASDMHQPVMQMHSVDKPPRSVCPSLWPTPPRCVSSAHNTAIFESKVEAIKGYQVASDYIRNAPADQEPGNVGCHLNACAYLAKLCGCFKNRDFESPTTVDSNGDGAGEPPNPSPHNAYVLKLAIILLRSANMQNTIIPVMARSK